MRISDWSSDVCSSDLGEMAVTALAVIGAKHAQPADQHGHLGHRKAEQRRAIEHHFLGFQRELLLAEIVAEGIGLRLHHRSEERRVGKECVSTCRSRWSSYH